MVKSEYNKIQAYTTKDGSVIRELMHPAIQGSETMSVAEAEIKPGSKTEHHCHHRSEEIYHILDGVGELRVDDAIEEVQKGDTICIPAKAFHSVTNIGMKPLKILCCCTPAYSHEDTELISV